MSVAAQPNHVDASAVPPPQRRLTPLWLSVASLIAGQRPPDLGQPFRYVMLGCGDGSLAADVAEAHQGAAVWAWDCHPEYVEMTRRLAAQRGLTNLHVHERSELPADLGGGVVDFLIVRDLLGTEDDAFRRFLFRAVEQQLRPGGLFVATYKTSAGWSEIAPVVALMRYIARRHRGEREQLLNRIARLLRQLRDGNAGHFAGRPAVAEWVDSLLASGTDGIAAYLDDDLRPLSHAELTIAVREIGLRFVGSARLTDELDLDVPAALHGMVAGAPSALLRETYRDLATKRADRCDVYRLGDGWLSPAEASGLLAEFGLPADPELVRRGMESGELVARVN